MDGCGYMGDFLLILTLKQQYCGCGNPKVSHGSKEAIHIAFLGHCHPDDSRISLPRDAVFYMRLPIISHLIRGNNQAFRFPGLP